MPGLGMQERSSKSQASVTYPSVKLETNKAWKKEDGLHPGRGKASGGPTGTREARAEGDKARQGSKSDDKNTQNHQPWLLSLSPLPRGGGEEPRTSLEKAAELSKRSPGARWSDK